MQFDKCMPYNIWNKLKSYLIAGLIAILPLWITYFVLYVVFNAVTSLAKPFLRNIPGLAATPLLLNIMSFLGTIIFVLVLGVFLANVVGQRLFLGFEEYLRRIPVLSWIYTAVRRPRPASWRNSFSVACG